MPEAASRGHIGKAVAAFIPVHHVWHERFVLGIARAEVKIQKPVVIEIPKIHPHRQGQMRKVLRARHVPKLAAAIALIQACSIKFVGWPNRLATTAARFPSFQL